MIGGFNIVAPDSSHWGHWLDAMRSPKPADRERAHSLHARLLEKGRLPLLSWHHIEELLGGKDDDCAAARVEGLQTMPQLAWFRLPQEQGGIGSVAHIFAAEALAVAEGANDLVAVRDRARSMLLMLGSGRDAIGEHGWVWRAIRPRLHARQDSVTAVATLGSLRTFDESKTIGELAKFRIADVATMRQKLIGMREQSYQQALRGTNGNTAKAQEMADNFVEQVIALSPPPGSNVRDLLVARLTAQGVDEDEIRDECILADLSRLGMFRDQLRGVARDLGWSFDRLKHVSMDLMPSVMIDEAIRTYRQPREALPGSDVHDRHLAVLSAYCEVLYVDKRTFEDMRRVRQKAPQLNTLMGEIAKASDFEGLMGS